jgi:hypothetical protein
VPTVAADYHGNDEFGPSAELLELIDNGRTEFFKDRLCRD